MGRYFLWIMVTGPKIKVQEVNSSDNVPHGIKYSLTLHDQNNRRIIGYDNAHGFKPNKCKSERELTALFFIRPYL